MIQFGVVEAQLYQNCQIDTSTGVTLQTCLVNRPIPLTYTAADGTAITLGTLSAVAVTCETSVPGTVDTCTCFILVDPGAAIDNSDICTSCTVSTISATEFDNYFDCSNRLTGPCVGLDVNGVCISNVDVPVPVTVPAPVVVTTTAPVADPAVPVVTPAPVVVTTLAPVVAEPTTLLPTLLPVASVPIATDEPIAPTGTDECTGKGKGMGMGMGDDSETTTGKGMMGSTKKKMGKKCKKVPKEPKVPKAGKGKGERQ